MSILEYLLSILIRAIPSLVLAMLAMLAYLLQVASMAIARLLLELSGEQLSVLCFTSGDPRIEGGAVYISMTAAKLMLAASVGTGVVWAIQNRHRPLYVRGFAVIIAPLAVAFYLHLNNYFILVANVLFQTIVRPLGEIPAPPLFLYKIPWVVSYFTYMYFSDVVLVAATIAVVSNIIFSLSLLLYSFTMALGILAPFITAAVVMTALLRKAGISGRGLPPMLRVLGLNLALMPVARLLALVALAGSIVTLTGAGIIFAQYQNDRLLGGFVKTLFVEDVDPSLLLYEPLCDGTAGFCKEVISTSMSSLLLALMCLATGWTVLRSSDEAVQRVAVLVRESTQRTEAAQADIQQEEVS